MVYCLANFSSVGDRFTKVTLNARPTYGVGGPGYYRYSQRLVSRQVVGFAARRQMPGFCPTISGSWLVVVGLTKGYFKILVRKAKMFPGGMRSSRHFGIGFLGLALTGMIFFVSPTVFTPAPNGGDPGREIIPETDAIVSQVSLDLAEVGDVPRPVGYGVPAGTVTPTSAKFDFPDVSAIRTITVTQIGGRVAAGIRVPILMYHYIRINPDPSDALGAGLSVAPSEFERQVRYLVDNGYQSITIEEVVRALNGGTGLPSRPFVLTFDDGYRDFYENAYPVLKRYGVKATSFIIVDLVGTQRYLTWDAIREMAAGGLVTFGSHTLAHPDLTLLSRTAAERELRQSKRTLEDRIGRPVTLFAYPSGRFDASVERLAQEAGYVAAVSTISGAVHTRDDLFHLSRVRVDGRGSFAGFVYNFQNSGPAALTSASVTTTSTTISATIPTTATLRSRSTPTPGPSFSKDVKSTPTPIPPPVPTPGGTVVVPNLVGLSEPDARQLLQKSGLDMGYTNYQTVKDVAPGSTDYFLSIQPDHVVSQQPSAGTILKRGEKVTLAVRKQ